MKKYLFSLIFLFLLFSSSVEAVEISTSIPSGSQYAPGRNYGFQIKCDDMPNVDNVIFEWNLANNYTANNISDTFYYNLTDLPVGEYAYKWYVNNTSDSLTYFDTYSILKNSSVPIVLTLDGTAGNKSYERYNIANFVVTLNIANKNVTLVSSYPNWTTIQNSTSAIYKSINLTASGLFTLTASWNGDNNYTSSSKNYYFDTDPPQFSSITSIPESPVGYVPDIEYKFQVTVKDATLVDVWFESNHTGTMKKYYSTSNLSVQNSSGFFWVTIKNLGAKKFSYKWHAKDDLDDESSTIFINYEILKMSPLVMDILPSTNIKVGTQITATCYSINSIEVPVSKFKFYKNSDLIKNVTSSTRMDVFLLSVGTYNFTCNTSGTANYSSQSITRNITISAAPPEDEEINGELKIMNLNFPTLIKTGESGEASFNLKNEMLKNIFNIEIDLTGISSEWYNIISQPLYVYGGKTKEVKINLNIPSDAEPKIYSITINVKGETSDGKTITVVKNLNIRITGPAQNKPPSYIVGYINTTIAGENVMFSLKWSDDYGLSGYIFSSNNSGIWENDSWTPLTGSSGWFNVTKILNSNVGSRVAWKIYANDTNNEWSISDENIVIVTEAAGFDMFFIIVIVLVIIIISVIAIIFIRKRKPKEKEEEVEYVYSREEFERSKKRS